MPASLVGCTSAQYCAAAAGAAEVGGQFAWVVVAWCCGLAAVVVGAAREPGGMHSAAAAGGAEVGVICRLLQLQHLCGVAVAVRCGKSCQTAG
jgi:hypothetical protein